MRDEIDIYFENRKNEVYQKDPEKINRVELIRR